MDEIRMKKKTKNIFIIVVKQLWRHAYVFFIVFLFHFLLVSYYKQEYWIFWKLSVFDHIMESKFDLSLA